MCKFVPNKSFGELFGISLTNVMFLTIFNSEFSYKEVGFTDQSSKLLEIEDEIKITLNIT